MLLLLFGGDGFPFPDLPLDILVTTAPSPTHGHRIQRPATTGVWRWVLELADPAAEVVNWHDITDFYAGDRHQFGADDYMGKARARLVTVQLQTDDDSLAPWGQDTSDLFGVNVPLDAGLIMRAVMARVVAGVTVEWEPIWTGRVERWGDAAAARGRIRTHEISVIDTFSSLAQVPVLIGESSDDWRDWFTDQLLPGAGWNFGVDIYGEQPVPTGLPFQENPAAAIALMDAGADPLGLAWRSLRSGRLVIHPLPWDTTNTERYPNPLLDVYPEGLVFSYSPDFTDIEYIADDQQQPFGLERNIAGILNYFAVTMPGDSGPEVYLNDDPVSISKYDVRPFTGTWIISNPPVVDDLLAARAYASQQALPLRTTLDHEGFWSALAIVDHLDPVTVIYQTRDAGLVVTGTGWVRNIVEERTWRGDGLLSWQSTVQVDIAATGTSEALLPVENLAFVGSDSPLLGTSSSAEFSWTNPAQPSITPTNAQYRVVGKSFIWTDTDYPGVGADGQIVANLEAATSYRFQVRLIRRVDGIITNFSIWREVRFTTAARIFPVPTPGEDPGDTDVIGTPPDDECADFEVDLQENDGTGWVTVDSFTGSELTPNGDGTYSLTYPIPNSFFNVGSIYRFRSSCDGVTWLTGPSFDPPDDWDDPCTVPPSVLAAPYDDAIVYVPQVCAPDIIKEYFSQIEAVKGDAYAGLVTGLADPEMRALLAVDEPAWDDTPGGIIAYGECPQIAGVTGDKTISITVNLPDAVDCVLAECAGMRLLCVETSGGWRAAVVVYKPGSTITLTSVSILDLDTTYVIMGSHDLETGTIVLQIDGVLENAVGGTDDVPTISALPIWRVGAPPEGWVTDFALWDRVVEPTDPDVPITSVAWDHVYWAEGPEFVALGLSDGASVSTWPDEIGTADLTEATNRPVYRSSGTGFGLPCVDFDGTNDQLGPNAMSSIAAPHTVVAIAYCDTVGFDGYIADGFDATHRLGLGIRATPLNWRHFSGSLAVGGTPTVGKHSVRSLSDTTSPPSDLYIDGVNVTSAVGGNGNQAITGLTLGNAYTGGTGAPAFDGRIAFVGIYDGDVTSDPGWLTFKAWALSKYGVTF